MHNIIASNLCFSSSFCLLQFLTFADIRLGFYVMLNFGDIKWKFALGVDAIPFIYLKKSYFYL